MILRWGTHSCLQGQKGKNFNDEQPVSLDTQVQCFFNGVKAQMVKEKLANLSPFRKKQDKKKTESS